MRNSLGNRRSVHSVGFADIVGSSRFKGETVKRRLFEFLDRFIKGIRGSESFVFAKPLGDGVLFVMDDAIAMTEAGLRLRDEFRTTDWRRLGFEHEVQVRVALHIATLNLVDNEDGKLVDVIGAGVDRCARLQEVAEPNCIVCSSAFEGTIQDEKPSNIGCIHLGKRALPKDEGEAEVYEVFWTSDSPSKIPVESSGTSTSALAVPKVRRKIGDAEKSDFLSNGWSEIRRVLSDVLQRLEKENDHVKIAIVSDNDQQFTFAVSVDGKESEACAVWVAGRSMWSSQGVFVHFGSTEVDQSYNGQFSVDEDGFEIFFSGGISFFNDDERKWSAREVAEVIWERILDGLNRG